MNAFDRARKMYPELILNAYAFDPRGPVTLEVMYPNGKSFPFRRPTLEAALAAAFGDLSPPAPEPTPEPEPALVAPEPTPEPAPVAPQPVEIDLFS